MHNLVPRGQYTSGKGSSAVGLTAYVTRDPETRQLVLQTWVLCFQTPLNCTYSIIEVTNVVARKLWILENFIIFEVSKAFLWSFSAKCVSHCLWDVNFFLHFFKEMPWCVGKSLILPFAACNITVVQTLKNFQTSLPCFRMFFSFPTVVHLFWVTMVSAALMNLTRWMTAPEQFFMRSW